jgi:D-alanyl-D-alanine carboxypeptidase
MALAVSEVLAPQDTITIPYDTRPAGTTVRLAAGSRWYAQDVIDFTLVVSSNEGADILAAAAENALHERYVQAPVGAATVWRMNDIVRQLHLAHTYFLNANGLDESTTQSGAYGTARDMAYLFSYAASTSPSTFAATAKTGVALTSLDGQKANAYNTDEALDAIPGVIMGKTGFTDLAGGNLAVVFKTAAGHTVTAIVLGSTQQGRFSDMKALVAASEKATAASLDELRAAGGTVQ